MEEGPKYALSKEGLIKLLVLLFGCTTFALFADSGAYTAPSSKTWAFAAYIISFAISFLFYFFHVTGLARSMNCQNCSYVGFDFLWSWISTIHIFAASITFATNINCDPINSGWWCDAQAISVSLGFVTFVLYGIEAFFLRSYAPANAGYIATLSGWVKSAILFGGGAAFGILLNSGYNWCAWQSSSCNAGVTYALAAYCIGWSVSVLSFFANILLPNSKTESKAFRMFEFVWGILCFLLFVSASSCFIAYSNCSNYEYSPCNQRLTGTIFGFITALLYVAEAVLNKPSK